MTYRSVSSIDIQRFSRFYRFFFMFPCEKSTFINEHAQSIFVDLDVSLHHHHINQKSRWIQLTSMNFITNLAIICLSAANGKNLCCFDAWRNQLCRIEESYTTNFQIFASLKSEKSPPISVNTDQRNLCSEYFFFHFFHILCLLNKQQEFQSAYGRRYLR